MSCCIWNSNHFVCVIIPKTRCDVRRRGRYEKTKTLFRRRQKAKYSKWIKLLPPRVPFPLSSVRLLSINNAIKKGGRKEGRGGREQRALHHPTNGRMNERTNEPKRWGGGVHDDDDDYDDNGITSLSQTPPSPSSSSSDTNATILWLIFSFIPKRT